MSWQSKLAGAPHIHGCVQCHQRYRCRCKEPGVDELCPPCVTQGSRTVVFWPESWTPRDCCRIHCRRLDSAYKDDRELLLASKVGGAGPWWWCRECWRIHFFDPATGYDPPITSDAWREWSAQATT